MTDSTGSQLPDFCDAREAGGLLFCSGQIGLDADGAVPGDSAAQFAAAFGALADSLRRHGCGIEDVVDLTSFHVGYPDHMDVFMQVKASVLPMGKAAWTAIGVAALGYPGSLVELKAVALVPNKEGRPDA